MELLTRLEEAILIAVVRLGDEAYGVSINREVSTFFERNYTLGGLYFALDQLTRKGFVSKRHADPTPQRGGRRKTYYGLTKIGRIALEHVKVHQERLWNAMPDTGAGT